MNEAAAKKKKPDPRFSRAASVDRIPMIDFDREKVMNEIIAWKRMIDMSRSEWYERKLEFMHRCDNFIDFRHAPIMKGHRWIHIPVIHEKIQAWHARMYKAITGVDPMFSMNPLNAVSLEEMEATKLVMQWYLRDEINQEEGLKPVIDEMLWDLGSDGWAVLFKHWHTVERKIIDVEENFDRGQAGLELVEMAEGIRRRGRPPKAMSDYREVEKVLKIWSGVQVETLPHECLYFPEYIPTSGDMNHPNILILEFTKTEEDYETQAARGFYDEKAVAACLQKGRGHDIGLKSELRQERKRMGGIEEYPNMGEQPLVTDVVFYRKDLDEDGVPEEYVFTVNTRAREYLRETYLDRICPDHKRPAYKFDLMKRPRSAYSRGFGELLASSNDEIDEMHNIRRVSAYIAGVPWGFYRATAGLEKEVIEIAPGKFYPVDDPNTDVAPMNPKFGNVTNWSLQEENLAQSYADKMTSMPAYLSGSVAGPVGPLRSNSGLQSLLQESQAPLDVYLDRFRAPFNRLLNGILADLRARLPRIIMLRVLGENGEAIFGADGAQLSTPLAKDSILNGKYRFNLAANDAQYNPEKDRQDWIAIGQMLMTQAAMQLGVLSPVNMYNVFKRILTKMGVKDFDNYITKPANTDQPLNVMQEFTNIVNGRMPKIVLNDDHAKKINGLMALAQSEEYQLGKELGNVNKLADMVLAQAVQQHQQFLEILNSMPAMPNQSGLEVPLTMGARASGTVVSPGNTGRALGGANARSASQSSASGGAEQSVSQSGLDGGGEPGEGFA
ncbi:MAG TPA: hypothetical protein VFW62_01555 [bacterium]|nr:hypothetical protein [bacterium]